MLRGEEMELLAAVVVVVVVVVAVVKEGGLVWGRHESRWAAHGNTYHPREVQYLRYLQLALRGPRPPGIGGRESHRDRGVGFTAYAVREVPG